MNEWCKLFNYVQLLYVMYCAVSDAEVKRGQTLLSEGPEGYVSLQLESGDGQLQAFTICETRQEGIKEKEATFVFLFFFIRLNLLWFSNQTKDNY